MRWLVIPTLVFAFLSRRPIEIGIVVAVAAALWVAKTRPLPATARPWFRNVHRFSPFAPALLIPFIFVMLGGSLIVIALLAAGVAAAVRYRHNLIAALEPWWNMQGSMPQGVRKVLAFGIPGLIGYYFGRRAGGREWTYTLISVSLGVTAAFLILFKPPDSMRRTGGA